MGRWRLFLHSCEKCSEIRGQINSKWYDGHNVSEDEVIDTIISCSCDKMGVNKLWYANSNGCDNCPEPKNRKRKQHCNKRKLNKREREDKYRRKLAKNAKLYHGAYLMDEKYVRRLGFVPVEKPYYKRYYRRRTSKYLKGLSNKKVRRYAKGISGKGGYRRLYDFWWEVD